MLGHMIGPDRADGASPFGHGSDETVAVAMLLRIAGQLVSASADMFMDGRAYAAKRTLDGEDRSGIMRCEGKGGPTGHQRKSTLFRRPELISQFVGVCNLHAKALPKRRHYRGRRYCQHPRSDDAP